MPRLIEQPIKVSLVKDSFYDEMRPASFTWRVQLEGGGVMELGEAHTQPPEWRLMVIDD